ncbi:adenine nucleotide alpha hydrolases-like protein [Acrodontium crateriforme]|uniref:Adenine nucleotide alpha hydrolases-like protein n=1 Tax=Acrodontium crateriforme TaxID=150365 RepID=A0AAQ3M5L9_9PEZI|nr:adenine nucleotide alpha hydrolases-like protein [Acrodontium crateriforme]
MTSTPSPRSLTPAPAEVSSSTNVTHLPDRTAVNSEQPPAWQPAWRRPTLTGTGERRPSVQFVPHSIPGKENTSRSSSARAPAVRRVTPTESTGSRTPNGARRLSSPPPPPQFRPSVSFDTFKNPSASDFSLTLNRKHKDYEYTKRSRTFLCGTDTHDYSDTALEWLIDELVDDGDEVVCLRVVEPDSREAVKWARGQGEKGYQIEANRFLEEIEKKNRDDRAISLVLEFSIGKVHDTIQQMIRIYEPAMLVVGTRGRSLTGYQGLLSSGSVSKYCLQYSPVPVIVVRPSSKREAKKRKRLQDPTRTGYRDILDRSDEALQGRGGHLLDTHNRQSVIGPDFGNLGVLGAGDPDEEARRVAEAIGWKGEGRPSLGARQRSRDTSLSRITSAQSTISVKSDDATSDGDALSPRLTDRLMKSPDLNNLDSPAGSDIDLDSADEDTEPLEPLPEVVRPEDEAAMLAYERAMKVVEEEKEEALAREQRAASRGRQGGRSSSRTAGHRPDEDEGGGGGVAVLDLLAKLDRGIK